MQNTGGTFTFYLDGSDVGLEANGEDIDGLFEYPDGSLAISTTGSIEVGGLPKGGDEDVHILMKVETHNHPTAISPYPGAATGSGGEIRDEGATGLGARPKAGLTGFSVSHLELPGDRQRIRQYAVISAVNLLRKRLLRRD